MRSTVTLALCLFTLQDVTTSTEDVDPAVSEKWSSSPGELRLVRELMKRQSNHRELSRPTSNGTSDVVTVSFGVTLVQILNFDQKDQVIQLLLWKRSAWVDPELTWNPEDYGDIQSVGLPAHLIWTPDIVLYSHVGNRAVEQHQEQVLLHFDGTIFWIAPVVYDSSCDVDMTHFPFDKQECSLKFGSWVYSCQQMDMEFFDDVNQLDLSLYLPSSQWDIINNTAEKRQSIYPCCPQFPYCDITYTIVLKRKSGFYTAVLLLPALLLSLLVLVIFWIPPQRPDRTTLGMSVFGSFVILLLVILESSPPSAAISLGAYCCISIILVTIATIFSSVMINVATYERPMPSLLKKVVVDWLARKICIAVMCGQERDATQLSSSGMYTGSYRKRPSRLTPNENAHHERGRTSNLEPLDGDVTEKDGDVTELQLAMHNKDWLVMTKVLDRVMFFIYTFVLFMCVMLVFPKPYNS